MTEALKDYNKVTFYVRRDYQPLIEEFNRLIKQDEIIIKTFNSKRKAGSKGLFSLSMIILIHNYIRNNNPDFKLFKKKDEVKGEIEPKKEIVKEEEAKEEVEVKKEN